MKIDFAGQIALVTGATRGIGRQIAGDLADLGATLILTGTNADQIKALNRDEQARKDPKRRYLAVDFTDAQSTARFLEEIRSSDRIDVCINNAGINRIADIDSVATQDLDDILAVNLKAPFLITREVSRIMKKNGFGRIVNIASIFGAISRPKRSAYSASKFGLRGVTVTSAIELARYNILVNTVSPGFVLTDLTRRILSEEEMAALAEAVPIGRFAAPEEISKTVLFLTSRLNTYITGQNIIIDGGYVNV